MGVILRQSIKGTLVNYLGAFIGALTTLFVTTVVLTESQIGLTRALVSAGELFAGLAQLGTNSSIIRYYPFFKSERHRDHGFFFWTLLVPAVGCLLYSVVFVVFKDAICARFVSKASQLVDFYNFTFLIGFFLLYMAVFESNANVLMRIVVPKFFREVGLRLLQLVDYALFVFNVIDFKGFVIIFCFTYGIVTLLNFCYLVSLKKISFRPDFRHITPGLRNGYLKYTAFTSTHAIVNNLAPLLSTFMVSAKIGLASTGIYTIAMYIARVIEMPYRSLGAISAPLISQSMKEGNMQETNRLGKEVSLHQFMVALMLFFLLYTNIDLIFRILPNGDTYALGRAACLFLGLQFVCSTTLSIGFSVLGYSRYYYMFLCFSIILTLSSFFLNNWLIPLYDTSGAAAATLLANILYFTLLSVFIGWKLHFRALTAKHLKVLLVMLAMTAVCTLYKAGMRRIGLDTDTLPVPAALCEAVLRSAVLAGTAVWLVWKMKISLQANQLLESILNKLKHRK